MTNGGPTESTTSRPARTRISVSVLQAEIRNRFLNHPTSKALGQVLRSVGMYFGAEYTVVHARLGVHYLSEEWCRDTGDLDDVKRELVGDAMLEAMDRGTAKILHSAGLDSSDFTVLCAPMLDVAFGQVGSMAVVIPNCDRETALRTLSLIESISGYMALMISVEAFRAVGTEHAFDSSLFAIDSDQADSHPQFLAITIVNELTNHFDLELAAIGFVQQNRIKIAAVSGFDEVRGSNPGVRLIRAAMEECLDRGSVILLTGDVSERRIQEDCRLHDQWSRGCDLDAVASFPLILQDETIAIVSVRRSLPTGITSDVIERLVTELKTYGPLLALCRIANRGIVSHLLDTLGRGKASVLGDGLRKSAIKFLIVASALCWMLFGTLSYSFTVPCRIEASGQRVVSCPRDGILADLFVHPGEKVVTGQLLAVLDDQDDVLERHSIVAEIATLDAMIDRALEDRDSGQIRIHEAQKRTLSAQLAVVEQKIKSVQIRAPYDSVILEGDLRARLGSRVPLGEALFVLAGDDEFSVVLEIPEYLILDARKSQSVSFATAADPGQRIELVDLRFAPSGTIRERINVFLAESTTSAPTRQLAPGMEGFAHMDVGPRPVWWVLSHRLTNWIRLRFWV